MSKSNFIVKSIPSSFVFGDMKLLNDKGAGEAKLFVGPKKKESEIDDFFQFNDSFVYRFDKQNMLEYLLQVKMEFVFQTINRYKDADIDKWSEIYSFIKELPDEQFVVCLEKYVDGSRYYIRANDELFKKIFRKMVIPKLTDLVFVKNDEDNEIVLYLQVNYEFSNIESEIENIEERNKRYFRMWMNYQVKPEGDSDAGNPYTETTIDQYVNYVATTLLGSMTEKSLFYTIDADEVEAVLNSLDNSENKNHVQRSAIKKYIEYLKNLVSEEDCEEIFKHNLFGIHIKEKNDALAEEYPHICIGWSAMGDLSDIGDKEELANRYDRYFEKNSRGRGQDIGQIWRFLNDVKIGDYVIFAENSVFHIGRVESNYFYDDSDNPNRSEDYKNVRRVRWIKKNISRSVLSANFHNSLKTAMSIWTLNDYKSAVAELLHGTYVKDEDGTEDNGFEEVIFNTTLDTGYERNRIAFGAPGTGKSHKLKKDCEEMKKEYGGSFERVTFHPDYSYAQFVGTYKPVMGNGDNIRYNFVPGPFMRVYVDALKSGRTQKPQPCLLLIEEINRARVSSVFGEVFQLLDRDNNGVSEYEIQATEDIRHYLASELGGSPENYKKIRIPNNMFIWATMNSADQGVFPMDTAFKRRWEFEYIGVDAAAKEVEQHIIPVGDKEHRRYVKWNDLRKHINNILSSDDCRVNEDKLLGPFFMSKNMLEGACKDEERFVKAFESKVIMYLFEDVMKMRPANIFKGHEGKMIFSEICKTFEEKGEELFGISDIEYIEKQEE